MNPASWFPFAWLAFLAVLPLVILGLALIWRGIPWHPRWPIGDLLRLATGVAFAGVVHPALAILAFQGAWYWVKAGWIRADGGLRWPLIATMLFLGTQVQDLLYPAILFALAVGAVETTLALFQWTNRLILIPLETVKARPDAGFLGKYIHGTIGHRTGLGIYLAILVPLAFLLPTPSSVLLAAWLGIGLILSMSSLAGVAAGAGMLWVHPEWWPVSVGVMLLSLGIRLIKPHPGGVYTVPILKWSIRSPDHVYAGRLMIWRALGARALRWPYWLWGYGPGSFDVHGRLWNRENQLREVYREAHNDYLEFFYEHGLVGILALGYFLSSLAWESRDPYTGALVAFAVSALANFPCRVPVLAGVGLLAVLNLR